MSLTFPEELAIGIAEVDEQHRAFYRHLNELHAAMRAHDLTEAARLVLFLDGYTREHFAAEERLMLDAGYPDFPEHMARHKEFVADLAHWRRRFDQDGPGATLVVELSAWLTGWLGNHIRRVDGPMAAYIRAHASRR